MAGGLLGMRDPSGQVVEKGWAMLGFPTESACTPGRGYDALRRNV